MAVEITRTDMSASELSAQRSAKGCCLEDRQDIARGPASGTVAPRDASGASMSRILRAAIVLAPRVAAAPSFAGALPRYGVPLPGGSYG